MKKSIIIPAAATAALSLASCQKNIQIAVPDGPQEIVLAVGGDDLEIGVDTKTTSAITSLPGTLYWSGTTGSLKSETTAWGSTSGTVSSGKIKTGKYQTAGGTAYNYYVSNNEIAFASGGSTISASNTTDVIAGVTTEATKSLIPSVTLGHVFARTGALTATSSQKYTVSNVTWNIASKGSNTGTAGTYNIAAASWSDATALSSTTITSSSDLYLIPGSYTVTLTYTLSSTSSGWSMTETKSADVTLVAGKINALTANITTQAGITIGVTLSAWTNTEVKFNL